MPRSGSTAPVTAGKAPEDRAMRRILPALGLALLAPLIAEFLLGDFP
ncbi:hypothetical protein [Nonomuraea sp. NPDC049695]